MILKKFPAKFKILEMNLFAVSCLIIIFPILAQVVFGLMLGFKQTKWNFNLFSIINMVTQIIAIILALKILEIDTQNAAVKCGISQAAMLFLGIISIVVLVIIIGIQIVIRKYSSRKVR